MSLRLRLARLERKVGTDDTPRRVIVFYGADETRHEIRREPWGEVHLAVPCPEGDDPMAHLSPEQRDLIGLSDSVAAYHSSDNGRDPPQIVMAEVGDDGRDPHLQTNRPPWKRRPWRFVGDNGRRWEFQDEGGVWRPGEELENRVENQGP